MPPHNGNLDRFLQPQPQQVGLVAAPAINDNQLVSLVAAGLYGRPGVGGIESAVLTAQEIIAEACAHHGRFLELAKAKKEAAAKAASPDPQ